MGIVQSIVIFTMIWWVVFFCTLPFGVRGQWEEGGGPEGTEPGAPVMHGLKRKIVTTTAISVVLTGVAVLSIALQIIDPRELPTPFPVPDLTE